MLRVLGSPKRFCDGITRRDMLWAGALAPFGLGLADYLRMQELEASPARNLPRSFGRAKSCILLFLYGSPSQLELADMKYEAPVEIRGELGGIRSSLPGCDVCELLPYTSRVMHNVTVSRSYRDEDGEWQESSSFGEGDLLPLAKALDDAHSWIHEQRQKAKDEEKD